MADDANPVRDYRETVFLPDTPFPMRAGLPKLEPEILKAWEEMQRKGLEFMDAPHLIHTHSDGTEEWMVFFKDLEDRPLALMSQVAPKLRSST